jgi:hypothetical protein
MKTLLLSLTAMSISACTWVELHPQAQNIVIDTPSNVQHCTKIGSVTANTRHQIIPGSERAAKKVAQELSILARNEAAKMNANTIVAKYLPTDGRQSFNTYHCSR